MGNHIPFLVLKSGNISRKFVTKKMRSCDKNFGQLQKSPIFLADGQQFFYDAFHFNVIGGHTPDSSVLSFHIGNDTYCITGDECYLCENMERNIPIGISSCREKNAAFIQKAYTEGWIPLPLHDPDILNKYDRLTENIVRIF